jgi:16S rRNA (guanine527-N7)-methyltransferase
LRQVLAQRARSRELRREVSREIAGHGASQAAVSRLTTFIVSVEDADPSFRILPKWKVTALERMSSSLAAVELEEVRSARRMADIGSGAGFPGLVLAAALPDLETFLIEKHELRQAFLSTTAAKMGLENVTVLNMRAQAWQDGRGTCDLVTARVVGGFHAIARFVAPLLKRGGACVFWGGKKRVPMLEAQASKAAEKHGMRLTKVHQIAETERADKVRHLYVFTKDG